MFYVVRNYAHRKSPTVDKPWLRVLGTLNEYQARLFVAERALQMGRGGISHLCNLTGMSRVTITQGVSELRSAKKLRTVASGRVRSAGGGRKKVEAADPKLLRKLRGIVEETTAGDPMSPLKWTSKSTRMIAEELTRAGHAISSVTVGRCLEEMGYTLQANVKTREGPQHPNRDAQFQYLNRQVKAFHRTGDPMISVDTKKKELVGAFKNAGRRWLPQGKPDEVTVHDFPHLGKGRAIPYGAYDIARNRAVVNVGSRMTRPNSPWKASGGGGAWMGNGITREPVGCSFVRTAEAAMATANAPGNYTSKNWPTKLVWRSRSVTIRREPASGIRSSTGCFPSSV